MAVSIYNPPAEGPGLTKMLYVDIISPIMNRYTPVWNFDELFFEAVSGNQTRGQGTCMCPKGLRGRLE
jgi:hypothetical protein